MWCKQQIALRPQPHHFMERYDQRWNSGGGCCKARLPSVWKYISHCSGFTPCHLCDAVASLEFTVSRSTRLPYCLFHPRLSARLEKASQEEISNPITGGASTPAAGAPQSECWWEQAEILNNRPAGVRQQPAVCQKPRPASGPHLLTTYNHFQWQCPTFTCGVSSNFCANEPIDPDTEPSERAQPVFISVWAATVQTNGMGRWNGPFFSPFKEWKKKECECQLAKLFAN